MTKVQIGDGEAKLSNWCVSNSDIAISPGTQLSSSIFSNSDVHVLPSKGPWQGEQTSISKCLFTGSNSSIFPFSPQTNTRRGPSSVKGSINMLCFPHETAIETTLSSLLIRIGFNATSIKGEVDIASFGRK
jgi:hypothetical protein